jgi:hypothetical protein
MYKTNNRLGYMAKKSTKKRPITPGPKPETLKLEGDWRDAVRKSLQKKKPTEGCLSNQD